MAEHTTPGLPASTLRNRIGLVLGPVVFVALLLTPLEPGKPELSRMMAVAALMAIWWITEAIPIPATALLPLVLYPFLGIMQGKAVAREFMNQYIFLFMGGFMIALALKKWNLHRRIALNIIWVIGHEPRRLVLGFMAATAFLSMWISNTATTMLMLPIGLSIIALIEEQAKAGGADADQTAVSRFLHNFPVALMLGIAYAASIGGVATLIGTPPNLSFARIFVIQFPNAPEIAFKDWFVMAAPFSAIFLLIAWGVLVFLAFPIRSLRVFSGAEAIRKELRLLGPISRPEACLGVVFFVTACLWMFRQDISFGTAFTLPGWTTLVTRWVYGADSGGVELGKLVDDGTIAILSALALFLIPSGRRKGERLMDWKTAEELPWGILLLFGGGFALAKGFTETGLSHWIGGQLAFLGHVPAPALVAAISTSITFLTELTSNTATTEMILPIIAGVAREIEVHPLLLMIPATISASCAFMLPVATPPNAIIFGSGYVPIVRMVKAGIILNVIGVLLVLLLVFTLALPVFDIAVGQFPAEWAAESP